MSLAATTCGASLAVSRFRTSVPIPELVQQAATAQVAEPEREHRAAVKLAQEAGKAVAHCCLAFMELRAGGSE